MENPLVSGVQGTLLAHSQRTSIVFLRSAKYRGPTTEPCGTPSLTDLTKTLLAHISQNPLNEKYRVSQRKPLFCQLGSPIYEAYVS